MRRGEPRRADGVAPAEVEHHEAPCRAPGGPPRAMVLVDRPQPQDSPILLRGSPARRGDVVKRRMPMLLGGAEVAAGTSGRLDLARAIVAPGNSLAARMIVNWAWMHHFGGGLVPAPGDLGLRGEVPVHRELLDDLARRFVDEGGWSLRWLHREIVTSRAFRQSSAVRADLAERDPDNRLFARANRRRLEWEAWRDSLLVAAATLDHTRCGGRGVDPLAVESMAVRSIYGRLDRQDVPGSCGRSTSPTPTRPCTCGCGRPCPSSRSPCSTPNSRSMPRGGWRRGCGRRWPIRPGTISASSRCGGRRCRGARRPRSGMRRSHGWRRSRRQTQPRSADTNGSPRRCWRPPSSSSSTDGGRGRHASHHVARPAIRPDVLPPRGPLPRWPGSRLARGGEPPRRRAGGCGGIGPVPRGAGPPLSGAGAGGDPHLRQRRPEPHRHVRPKPALAAHAGREIPNALPTERRTGAALPSPFRFSRHGESGLEVSELFPSVARHADRLLVVRSMHADVPNHEPSLMLMNCGDARLVRPSAGGVGDLRLGTENQNLPGFVAMCPGGYPIKESRELAERLPARRLPGHVRRHEEAARGRSAGERPPSGARPRHAAAAARPHLARSTAGTWRRGRTTRSSKPGSRRWSSPGGCSRRRPRHSTSSRGARSTCSRPLRRRRAGPADAHRAAARRAGRAVRAGLARRRAALGQPREHRDEPPATSPAMRPADRRRCSTISRPRDARQHARASGGASSAGRRPSNSAHGTG